MRIFLDTASLADIEKWGDSPFISGFTTNPTLMRQAPFTVDGKAYAWAKEVVSLTMKPISIDGPEDVWELGPNVYRKVIRYDRTGGPLNHTAICHERQLADKYRPGDIVSVFCGRIMDTGRNPLPVLRAAQRKGCQVLWASVREPYNIVQAEKVGCDIVTVPPAILEKWLEWRDKPLTQVAAETIAQFEHDRQGLW